MEELLELQGKRGLVLGIGGGGDVASAALLHLWLGLFKAEAKVGGVVWERFPVDPTPGPIALSEIKPAKRVGACLAWVTGEAEAKRGDRRFKPQVARVAEALGEEALAIDLWAGPKRVAEDLHRLAGDGFEFIVGVDVGGDVLATGEEDGLWSPLADQVMLAALAQLEERGIRVILAVHGLGVDGELSEPYLLRRLSLLASKGGYLGALGMGRRGAERLKKVLSRVETESSALPLLAFEGGYGYKALRSSTRGVKLSLISSITFLVDPLRLFGEAPMAKALASADSLEEANERLHELGVYTELDLERDLYEVYRAKGRVTRRDVLKVKREGLSRLRGGYTATSST